jgi:uncharacterized protein (TIGR02300 family)
MARDQRGTKRVCRNCGARFYDLDKTPIVCPACATVYQIAAPPQRRVSERAAAAKAPRSVAPVDEPAIEEADEDTVSLEEVEEPSEDDEDDVVVIDDKEDEDVGGDDDDDVFLETEDDEEGDVSDIVKDVDDERDR